MTTHLAPTAAVSAEGLGLLRFALRLDAAVSAANGMLYLAGFWLLDAWLGVPALLLACVGAFYVAYGSVVGLLALRPAPPSALVATVIVGNAGWGLVSVLALAGDWFTPTPAGQAAVALGAAAVLGFAGLQCAGLRRA